MLAHLARQACRTSPTLFAAPTLAVTAHLPHSLSSTQELASTCAHSENSAPLWALRLWALPSVGFSATSAAQPQGRDAREAMANKLLYRSKQRGFLELDLLMGLWAEENIPKMDMRTLHDFAVVLDQENPDIFKWLTGQEQPPEPMRNNSAFMALLSNVQGQLNHKRDGRAVTPPGKEWSRGWDDLWKNPSNRDVPTKEQ